MNVILIIPTGLGLPIGGHAGDATPVARLLAATCDKLILHPNVVNASDINEMPSNAWYVTGATIDDLLSGSVGLAEVYGNRIAVLVNQPVPNELVNVVSAARATLGIDAFIVSLPTPLKMTAGFAADGSATGKIEGAEAAVARLQGINLPFDAVAVITGIEVSNEVALSYVRDRGVNPWGGVEAKLTRIMTDLLGVPCAHAPFGHTLDAFNEVVDPRLAAEMVSETYAFCALKGLHQAPKITDGSCGLTVGDIDALVSPVNCFGVPHQMCLKHGIPILVVEENDPVVKNVVPFSRLTVASYAEAAGTLLAMREGITLGSLRRPLRPTEIY